MKKILIGWLAALALIVSGCGASATQIMKDGAAAQAKQDSLHVKMTGDVNYQGTAESFSLNTDYTKKPLQVLGTIKAGANGSSVAAGLYVSQKHLYVRTFTGGWEDMTSFLGNNLNLSAVGKAQPSSTAGISKQLMKDAKVARTPSTSTITLKLTGKAAQSWLKQAFKASTKATKAATKDTEITQKDIDAVVKDLNLKKLDLRLVYDHHTKLPKSSTVKFAIVAEKHTVTVNLKATYSQWGTAKVVAPTVDTSTD